MHVPQRRRVLLYSRDNDCKTLLLGASWPGSIDVEPVILGSSLLGFDDRQLASCNCLIVHEDTAMVGRLRQSGFTHPILCLVGEDDVKSRIAALDTGADDCLGPVFSLAEFIARTEALCRRQTKTAWSPAVEECGFRFSAESGTLSRDGQMASLTRIEARMLTVFLENLGRVLSAEDMGSNVWEKASGVSTNLICVHVRNLRSKLKDVLNVDPIRTVRGRGYLMESDPSPALPARSLESRLNRSDLQDALRNVVTAEIEGNINL
ncbi:MAG: response regulator transcription factor [Myxococcota bacterium]|nr:response regulator transcription factor [Myxococcota bacterium]